MPSTVGFRASGPIPGAYKPGRIAVVLRASALRCEKNNGPEVKYSFESSFVQKKNRFVKLTFESL